MYDDGEKTLWPVGGSVIGNSWGNGSSFFFNPVKLDFTLPGNLLVKKIQLEFEHVTGRTCTLKVERSADGVTYSGSPNVIHDVNGTYSYEPEEPTPTTNVRITLIRANDAAWPAIDKVKIWAKTVAQTNNTTVDKPTMYSALREAVNAAKDSLELMLWAVFFPRIWLCIMTRKRKNLRNFCATLAICNETR